MKGASVTQLKGIRDTLQQGLAIVEREADIVLRSHSVKSGSRPNDVWSNKWDSKESYKEWFEMVSFCIDATIDITELDKLIG